MLKAQKQQFLLELLWVLTWEAESWTSQRFQGTGVGRPPSLSERECDCSDRQPGQISPGRKHHSTNIRRNGSLVGQLQSQTHHREHWELTLLCSRNYTTHCVVKVHRIHIGQAGAHFAPVTQHPTGQVFCGEVHWQTSRPEEEAQWQLDQVDFYFW